MSYDILLNSVNNKGNVKQSSSFDTGHGLAFSNELSLNDNDNFALSGNIEPDYSVNVIKDNPWDVLNNKVNVSEFAALDRGSDNLMRASLFANAIY